MDLPVIPTWIRQQLQDQRAPGRAPRAKAEFRRLHMEFILTPVRNEGWPFLRAVGTGDLSPLCRVTDLPQSTRGRPPNPRPLAIPEDLPTRGQSPPGQVPGWEHDAAAVRHP